MGYLSLAGLLSCAVILTIAHTHTHEAPHMKYSREVNEAAKDDHEHAHAHSHGAGGCPHAHAHAHSHDHGHDHGHSHEHHTHAHSHEAHDHSQQAGAHGHSHGGHTATKRSIPEYHYEGYLSFMNDAKTRVWVQAVGATLIISAAPCFILLFIPIQANTAESGPLLKVLLAFGSGGLLGDAFLHLIPHALPAGDSHGHSHAHAHEGGHGHSHDNSVGGWVLGGIIAFLFVEKIVRILRGGDDGHGHSHGGHSHSAKAKHSDDESDSDKKGKGEKKKKSKEGEKEEKNPHTSIKVAAYLNLVADFAHNFTDGLAIGASFIAGPTVGFVTMITVLVHEVPHEIGDFAILIQSGYSKRKAMLVQLVTALGALSGCVLSLWAGDAGHLADAAASSWVLPFTAGGFIYIATVSVIPELLENSSLVQSLKEIFALLAGIYMMYLIALYE